jgi:hypothetical protein
LGSLVSTQKLATNPAVIVCSGQPKRQAKIRRNSCTETAANLEKKQPYGKTWIINANELLCFVHAHTPKWFGGVPLAQESHKRPNP